MPDAGPAGENSFDANDSAMVSGSRVKSATAECAETTALLSSSLCVMDIYFSIRVLFVDEQASAWARYQRRVQNSEQLMPCDAPLSRVVAHLSSHLLV